MISIIWKLISSEKYFTATIFSMNHTWSEKGFCQNKFVRNVFLWNHIFSETHLVTKVFYRKRILLEKYFVIFSKRIFTGKIFFYSLWFQKNIFRHNNFQAQTCPNKYFYFFHYKPSQWNSFLIEIIPFPMKYLSIRKYIMSLIIVNKRFN